MHKFLKRAEFCMVNERIIEEWVAHAQEDLELARHLISEKWFYRAALAHLQQAVEKYTKAFLILKGWELRKIHDLETLFEEALKHDSYFEKYLEFGRKLTRYYQEGRYPPMLENEPAEGKVRELLKIAEALIAKIEQLIGKELKEK